MITHNFFLNPDTMNQDLDIVINNIGYSHNPPGYTNGYHKPDYYIFHYIHSGKGIYHVNDKIYNIHENEGFMVFPDTTVFYQASYDDPWSAYWIGFKGHRADYFAEQMRICRSHPVYQYSDSHTLNNQMIRLYQEIQKQDLNQERLLMLFYELVSLFSQTHSPKNTIVSNYLDICNRFMQNYYNIPVEVGDLAQECHISTTQLYRYFQKTIHITPHKYIENFKMDKAKELISTTDLSYQEISYLLGYEYESHFFKVFKRNTGKTPSCFRLGK